MRNNLNASREHAALLGSRGEEEPDGTVPLLGQVCPSDQHSPCTEPQTSVQVQGSASMQLLRERGYLNSSAAQLDDVIGQAQAVRWLGFPASMPSDPWCAGGCVARGTADSLHGHGREDGSCGCQVSGRQLTRHRHPPQEIQRHAHPVGRRRLLHLVPARVLEPKTVIYVRQKSLPCIEPDKSVVLQTQTRLCRAKSNSRTASSSMCVLRRALSSQVARARLPSRLLRNGATMNLVGQRNGLCSDGRLRRDLGSSCNS